MEQSQDIAVRLYKLNRGGYPAKFRTIYLQYPSTLELWTDQCAKILKTKKLHLGTFKHHPDGSDRWWGMTKGKFDEIVGEHDTSKPLEIGANTMEVNIMCKHRCQCNELYCRYQHPDHCDNANVHHCIFPQEYDDNGDYGDYVEFKDYEDCEEETKFEENLPKKSDVVADSDLKMSPSSPIAGIMKEEKTKKSAIPTQKKPKKHNYCTEYLYSGKCPQASSVVSSVASSAVAAIGGCTKSHDEKDWVCANCNQTGHAFFKCKLPCSQHANGKCRSRNRCPLKATHFSKVVAAEAALKVAHERAAEIANGIPIIKTLAPVTESSVVVGTQMASTTTQDVSTALMTFNQPQTQNVASSNISDIVDKIADSPMGTALHADEILISTSDCQKHSTALVESKVDEKEKEKEKGSGNECVKECVEEKEKEKDIAELVMEENALDSATFHPAAWDPQKLAEKKKMIDVGVDTNYKFTETDGGASGEAVDDLVKETNDKDVISAENKEQREIGKCLERKGQEQAQEKVQVQVQVEDGDPNNLDEGDSEVTKILKNASSNLDHASGLPHSATGTITSISSETITHSPLNAVPQPLALSDCARDLNSPNLSLPNGNMDELYQAPAPSLAIDLSVVSELCRGSVAFAPTAAPVDAQSAAIANMETRISKLEWASSGKKNHPHRRSHVKSSDYTLSVQSSMNASPMHGSPVYASPVHTSRTSPTATDLNGPNAYFVPHIVPPHEPVSPFCTYPHLSAVSPSLGGEVAAGNAQFYPYYENPNSPYHGPHGVPIGTSFVPAHTFQALHALSPVHHLHQPFAHTGGHSMAHAMTYPVPTGYNTSPLLLPHSLSSRTPYASAFQPVNSHAAHATYQSTHHATHHRTHHKAQSVMDQTPTVAVTGATLNALPLTLTGRLTATTSAVEVGITAAAGAVTGSVTGSVTGAVTGAVTGSVIEALPRSGHARSSSNSLLVQKSKYR